ncbi:MAG: hypothetical protein V3V75_02130, partial [Thermoguttaceae bacterium]
MNQQNITKGTSPATSLQRLQERVGDFLGNLEKAPGDDYSNVTIQIGGVDFVHQPNVTTTWVCPVCATEREMTASDLAEVGTPFCASC